MNESQSESGAVCVPPIKIRSLDELKPGLPTEVYVEFVRRQYPKAELTAVDTREGTKFRVQAPDSFAPDFLSLASASSGQAWLDAARTVAHRIRKAMIPLVSAGEPLHSLKGEDELWAFVLGYYPSATYTFPGGERKEFFAIADRHANPPDILGRSSASLSDAIRKAAECVAARVKAGAIEEPQAEAREEVDHPSHYGGKDNPYEVVKVCEAWGLDADAYLFNVITYIARAGKKDGTVAGTVKDLRKAAWYLNRRIRRIEEEGAL